MQSTVGTHHVESEERIENVRMGMWLFLSSEVMFFTAFFGMYIILRISHPELYHPHQLNIPLATVNSIILLTSSYFMAMAVHEVKKGNTQKLSSNLLITLILGVVFLIIKGIEYDIDFQHHIFPSTNLFYGCYYTLTGLHGVHMIVGVVILFILWLRAKRGDFSSSYYSPIVSFGLYWSFVEIVWFFIYAMVYLV